MLQLLHIDQAGKVYQAEQLAAELTWSGDWNQGFAAAGRQHPV